ncbi:gliding motility-associated ABC transporter substrate-binding protein GldG [Lunatibacter salilacus]|uniref:gliding motility-associated ABC transporter substrate-binding protein GldG n=1 Tax=Lunatibacter salilacus TaxID=2483804 RepID=UPI00131D9F82|nr:gliding motility-associated ABC transporter substrate-binding protein GldG [Lunatibacter salilacus]
MSHNTTIFLKVLLLLVIILVVFSQAANWLSFRWDLTEEGRYSISDATKEILVDLDTPIEVEILLTGDLPGGMRRFQKAIEQTIKTFDAYSSQPIRVFYQNPLELPSDIQREYILTLADYGINPTNLHASRNGGQTSRMIFPGIVVRNEEYELGALLLKGEQGMSPDEILNMSIENLEFEIGRAIKRLVARYQRSVGLIMGHGEMDADDGFGMVEALSDDFEIYKVPLDQADEVADLMEFEALIIAGPQAAFTEREKYLLDQYLMYGGNLLFFIDQLAVDLKDADGNGTIAMPFDSGLDDLLFRYGIRINRDLIQDLNFGYHPVVAGEFGNQSQIVPLPWPFYVMAGNMADHPITKGLDQVQFRFVSTMDTVKADGVKKIPLIFSSEYSKKLDAPVRVAFEDMVTEPEIGTFRWSRLPLAYLLEGEFTSYFKNRFVPEGFDPTAFRDSGSVGKVMVVGDGSFIKSMSDPVSGETLPLGQDPIGELQLANREFLQHTMQYLSDPDGIIASRTKQFQIRPLNRVKVTNQKTFWQFINIGMPIFLIIAIGWGGQVWRKRRYEQK